MTEANFKDRLYCGPLNRDAFVALLNGDFLAVIVPEFTPAIVVDQLARFYAWLRLDDYEIYNSSTNSYRSLGVKRQGIPFNTTYRNDPAAKKNYYDQVPGAVQEIRSRLAPFLLPIDHLRLSLDEIWPHGAGIANFNGEKNHVGIFRQTEAEFSQPGEEPHTDGLPREIGQLLRQLSANIYIDLPPAGGELLLWPTDEIASKDLALHQQVAPVEVTPKPGMLILFNTRKPHAIRSFREGKRSSLQCFIGVQPDHRIVLWN